MVAGFLVHEGLWGAEVLLVQKARPAWMAGRWNGVGGHVEPGGETSREAMGREFREETGLAVAVWRYFASLNGCNRGDEWEVAWYVSRTDVKRRPEAVGAGDEPVSWFSVRDVQRGAVDTLHNLPWLMTMAVSMRPDTPGYPYTITEYPAHGR